MNYFHNPSLLEFIAENPVRHNKMPENIVAVTEVILKSGVDQNVLDVTLALVATGSVPQACGKQEPLIDLLCDWGADPDSALHAAVLHGSIPAVNALIRHGAKIILP